MTTVDIPAALRAAAAHVRENRTKSVIEALTVSVYGIREYAVVVDTFEAWLSATLSRDVTEGLEKWAASLPVVSTLVDYLSYAADDIERDAEVAS